VERGGSGGIHPKKREERRRADESKKKKVGNTLSRGALGYARRGDGVG